MIKGAFKIDSDFEVLIDATFLIKADIFVKILVELLMILVLTFSKIKVNFKDFGVIFNTFATFLKSRRNFSRFR